MRLSLVVCLLLIINIIKAQELLVKGQVIDELSREPIPFANVYIKNTTKGVSANIDGFFKIAVESFRDTLVGSSVGHKLGYLPLRPGIKLGYLIKMQPSEVALKEIVVKPGENPAHVFLRQIWDKKDQYNLEKIPLWQAELYNKVEIDLENIDASKGNRLGAFSFILENLDTTSDEVPFLPIFLTESLSDYYYQSAPKKEKEFIRASRLSGVKDKNITKFLGGMYQKVNLMDNWVEVLDVSFVSPFSSNGLMYYKYYLTDSVFTDGEWLYQISFQEKRRQENTFVGDFWIDRSRFFIRELNMRLSKGVNINFVDRLSIRQSYQNIGDSICFLSNDRLMVDFKSSNKGAGIIGRRTISYKDVTLNDSSTQKYLSKDEGVMVALEAYGMREDFWETNRHEKLSKNEAGIYSMVDSLKNMPQFNTLIDIITTVVTGYQSFGPLDFGPYFSLLSSDQIEGNRMRIGCRTNKKFHPRLRLNAYAAYGFLDNLWKYGGGFSYLISNKNWQKISFNYKTDFMLEGTYADEMDQDNLFAFALRKDVFQKLLYIEEWRMDYSIDWFRGFSTNLYLVQEKINPFFEFNYFKEEALLHNINNVSLGVRFRWNHKEETIEGNYDKLSLGSPYPILTIDVEKGLSAPSMGDFDFHKISFKVKDNILINPLGRFYYDISAGAAFGDVPYLLQYNPKANNTYYYTWRAFNNMLPFEFAFKDYLEIQLYHHFRGFLLNKVPLVRHLKWRSVLCAKAIAGTGSEDIDQVLRPISWDKPYVELGAGLENIFKIIRVDAVWRVNHNEQRFDQDFVERFAIYTSLQLQF